MQFGTTLPTSNDNFTIPVTLNPVSQEDLAMFSNTNIEMLISELEAAMKEFNTTYDFTIQYEGVASKLYYKLASTPKSQPSPQKFLTFISIFIHKLIVGLRHIPQGETVQRERVGGLIKYLYCLQLNLKRNYEIANAVEVKNTIISELLAE